MTWAQGSVGVYRVAPQVRPPGPSIASVVRADIDFQHDILEGRCITSGGPTQDVVNSNWPVTPKACIVVITKCSTYGSVERDASMCICFFDGTTYGSSGIISIDNVSTTNTHRVTSISSLKLAEDPTIDADGKATLSFISGGVRFNWSTLPSGPYRIQILAFGGTSVSAKVQEWRSSATIGGAVNVTHATDTPTDILFQATNLGSTEEEQIDAEFGIGFAVLDYRNDDNRAIGTEDWNAQTVTTGVALRFRDDAIGFAERMSSATTAYCRAERHPDGFTSITIDNNKANDFQALSLNIGKAQGPTAPAKVATYTAPASTGDNAVTGLGFSPGLVVWGHCAASSTTRDTGTTAGPIGYGMMDENHQVCASVSREDGITLGVTNNECLADRRAAHFNILSSGSTKCQATRKSMDADGFTLTHDAVSGSTQLWAYLALGSTPAPPPPDVGHDYLSVYRARRTWNPLVVR